MLLEYVIIFLIIAGALLIGLNIGYRLRRLKGEKHADKKKGD